MVSSTTSPSISNIIAAEINCRPAQVDAVVELIEGGATIPFIARYRKEATGGLDDTQLRTLDERLTYLRDLAARRETVFRSITDQGKMTVDLAIRIAAVTTKAELEDLYLPYKPKRRTKAEIARERGLGPLAESILFDQSLDPEQLAPTFINADLPDTKSVLDGARDIISETFAENPDTIQNVKTHIRKIGKLKARVVEGKEQEGAKFADYFNHTEDFSKAPGHRILAMLRARNEEVISLDIDVDGEATGLTKPVEQIVINTNQVNEKNSWLTAVAKWTWRIKLSTRLSLDLMTELREKAEAEAINVFARNLKDLLLASPAGSKTTLGLDPGIRTGVKVAAVDATGKLLTTTTIYPFQPRNEYARSLETLREIVRRHGIELIAIGNGTASRETDKLAADVMKSFPDSNLTKIIVSEAGASVYSASALAAAEMPDIDVSLRGAVSIARRLQDPLAELVKIEPKSIGVGQYQHDVDQYRLAKALDAAVEDAVNAVGVDLNTASPALLARVSGLGTALAEAIVAHRNSNGAFKTRKQLLDVARLGARAFEQCAGFLRIRDGDEPLDASSVHPEAYPIAKKIIKACGRDIRTLMRDSAELKKLDPRAFVDERFGLPTVKDILGELEKPGRDPRPEFKMAVLTEGVNEIADLKPGMELEGTVTNVAAFGAFVDIGVHQDGLVHVSEIADRFVKDPSDILKAGDIVKVKVLEIDAARKRISLSMRKNPSAEQRPSKNGPAPTPVAPRKTASSPNSKQKSVGGFGDALIAAMQNKK